jgi:hypothetical protein
MKRFRHRPMRVRFAILATVALLWSQLVLAAHPLCSTAAMAMSGLTRATANNEPDCHHEQAPPTEDNPLCVAHCSQGDQTNDVVRIPVIPALPHVASAAVTSLIFLPAHQVTHVGLPPPVSWHRPTAHPAALLLI